MTVHSSGMAATIAGTASATVVAMSYTSGEVLLILAAVGTLVTIIGGQIVSIIVTMRANRDISKKVDENTAVTTAVAEKAASIEHATNSAATKAEEIITALRQQIKYQERSAHEDKERANTLAQAAAVALAHTGNAKPSAAAASDSMSVEAKEAIENLKKIDVNTKAIEENTAATDRTVQKTEATVQDIKDKQS